MRKKAVAPPPGTSTVLILEEVAAELRVHPNTVSDLLKSGELRGFKVGPQWRIHRTALNQYMGLMDDGGVITQATEAEVEGAHI